LEPFLDYTYTNFDNYFCLRCIATCGKSFM